MAISKVIYYGETLIDLTGDDVSASDVQYGIKFHLPDGTQGTGSCTYDADTRDATAVAAEILSTKTAYKNGEIVVGTMPNRGGVTGVISGLSDQYTIQQGYHDGSGKVSIDSTEQAKLIAANIREGITILGVLGTMSSTEGMHPTPISITPLNTAQTFIPTDVGNTYNSISQVNVAAVPYVETDNVAGGKTVTIGSVS